MGLTDADLVRVMKKVKVGQKLRLYYGKGNWNNCLYHIRAVVDDDFVVMRYWGKRKQWWHYVVESSVWLTLNDVSDNIQWNVR